MRRDIFFYSTFVCGAIIALIAYTDKDRKRIRNPTPISIEWSGSTKDNWPVSVTAGRYKRERPD